MKAGRLRHKVTIQSVTATQDAYGAPVNTWATFLANVPMSLEPMRGREMQAAQSQFPQVETAGEMRYATGVLPTMRVVTADSETYVIRSVLPDATARRELRLWLEKGVTTE